MYLPDVIAGIICIHNFVDVKLNSIVMKCDSNIEITQNHFLLFFRVVGFFFLPWMINFSETQPSR